MDHDGEELPLLRENDRAHSYAESEVDATVSEESVGTTGRGGGATVNCRVCDAVIDLEGRGGQHVVKCASCQEATPIRPAPAGKKYVRCPCNCLLICKAASTRIACPRTNCRRVITLGHREPQGSAVRAPTGSCRVSCVHCNEVFLFNTLNNSLANCPHCKRNSTIGGFAHRRAMMYLALSAVLILVSVFFTVMTSSRVGNHPVIYLGWIICYSATLYLLYKFGYFWMVKMSTVLGPI